MGIHDRDWYRDQHKAQQAVYDPKPFRRGREGHARPRWLPIAVALVVGVVLGFGVAWWRFQAWLWPFR